MRALVKRRNAGDWAGAAQGGWYTARGDSVKAAAPRGPVDQPLGAVASPTTQGASIGKPRRGKDAAGFG